VTDVLRTCFGVPKLVVSRYWYSAWRHGGNRKVIGEPGKSSKRAPSGGKSRALISLQRNFA